MNIEKLQNVINELEEHCYSIHPSQKDLFDAYRASINELVRLIYELKW